MKALVFDGKERIDYRTVDDPSLEDSNDAIVRVEVTAICGSDLHIYHGRETGLDRGTVMGHEFAGEVVETGENVSKVRTGDRVASPFTTSCGECFYCRRGLTARCVKGQLFGWVEGGEGLHGAQAEYVRVPMAGSTLMPLPAGIGYEQGLLLGDILSTGYFCADMAGVEPGGKYVVTGCGPVGLMAIASSTEQGAEEIYAVDSVEHRLELAERFGATAINFEETDAVEALMEAAGGRGVDAAMEAVGSNEAGRFCMDVVRPGGIISVVGVQTVSDFPFSPVEAYDKNLTYRVGRCSARYYMEKLIPMAGKRGEQLASIITHRLPLGEGVEGYRMFDRREDNCIKIILRPE